MPEPSKNTRSKQSPEAKPITLKNAKYVDGSGYYSFYANNVAFAVNQVDIALVFSEIIDVSPELEATIERRARVTLNPAQAKAIGKILEYAVSIFEAQNGPVVDLPMNLPVPPVHSQNKA